MAPPGIQIKMQWPAKSGPVFSDGYAVESSQRSPIEALRLDLLALRIRTVVCIILTAFCIDAPSRIAISAFSLGPAGISLGLAITRILFEWNKPSRADRRNTTAELADPVIFFRKRG